MSVPTAFMDAGFDSHGNLFAAVFQGLDAHRLRVVPTSAANAALAQDFTFDPQTRVSTLSWTTLPVADKAAQQKKRKKGTSTINGTVESSESIVVGTTQGTVLIYQPSTSSVVATLSTGSTAPVTAINTYMSKLFVLQRDSTLTEFELAKLALNISSVLPVPEPTAFAQPFDDANSLVVANSAPHELKNNEIDVVFNGFATAIAQVLPLNDEHFAALSSEDRQVFVYARGQPKPLRALVCPSTNAMSMSASPDGDVLAVVSEDGKVHVFDLQSDVTTTSATSRRARGKNARAVPQVTPAFSINVILAKRGSVLPVFRTKFTGPSLILAWPEQGSVPVFESISWKSAENILRTEDITLEKAPAAPMAQEHLVGGIDPASAPTFSEGKAKVVTGADTGDLSDASDDETLAERLETLEVELNKQTKSTSTKKPASGTPQAEQTSKPRQKDLQLKLSQPGSFATLLNQALTLNDKQLLEICLEERDPAMIKTSIVKLEPPLAAALLEHLAATAARSLNRSTTLAQWIRWTVVIHGAYLVTLPNLLRTLAGLHSTLSTRAATLPRLLALQGRLELLEEQLSVRNEYAAAQAAAEDDADEPEIYYDEDEAMIVNGEEANDQSDDEEINDQSEDDQSEIENSDSADDGDEGLDDDEILLD